ncbi:hypothetical protein KL919_002745 [Ogataea angusta]|nr:hypothetical protein KL919_002745 [Ogataea angusta]
MHNAGFGKFKKGVGSTVPEQLSATPRVAACLFVLARTQSRPCPDPRFTGGHVHIPDHFSSWLCKNWTYHSFKITVQKQQQWRARDERGDFSGVLGSKAVSNSALPPPQDASRVPSNDFEKANLKPKLSTKKKEMRI